MMAATSAARLPGVMAAAAALATAATSADFPHRLQQKTPSTMFYASQPTNLFSSLSACETISQGLANTCFASSLPLVHEVSCATSPPSCPSPKVLSQLRPFSLFHSSFAPPPSVSSTSRLPVEELPKHFSGQTMKYLPTSALYGSSSPRFSSSYSPPLFDLPAHLAALFPSSSASSSPCSRAGAWNAMHTWHTPTPGSFSTVNSNARSGKPAVTVVLLGWLGSQQKHLRKYAEWYNARGIHAVTFTVPMADILSFTMGGKAEAHVDELATHLAMWLAEEHGDKHLIFHTFSNTGWLTYGVVLEKLLSRGTELVDKIKGCVVDSAPAADPDPQVWASGFSAALLKKRSVATQRVVGTEEESIAVKTVQPHMAEAALLLMLEKFFTVFLQIPAINQRLTQVVNILSKQQPNCPQLYIYSTADKVIPAKSVESFIEQQRQSGRIVRACNLQSSPHVDHFRSFPDIYGRQVSNFLQECSPKFVH